MAIIGSDQISLTDVTDGYAVTLTNDSYTFIGSINAAKAGSTTTQVIVMRGATQVPCTVELSSITKPSGVTITSDGDATSPTLTITVSTSVKDPGVVKIPVKAGDVTIVKEFSFSIAFTGATGNTGNGISSSKTTYQKSTNGTAIPTGTWSESIPSVSAGEYLWTKTEFTYTNGETDVAYSVGMMGATGNTGKGISGYEVTYQSGTSGTTAPKGTWSSTIPSVAEGNYLWTRTVTTFSDGDTETSYAVSYMGKKGEDGADAITVSVTSSNGLIFKNTSIATVLTAHVYQGGKELTENEIKTLGTVKWYKDGSATAEATGINHTIDAGDVANKATFIAQLEG